MNGARPPPIDGVATGTAGAVGVTRRGPASGPPVLVTGFRGFVRTFGGSVEEPGAATAARWAGEDGGHFWHFPLSVRGFFENGGRRLFVKRVVARTVGASGGIQGRGLVAHVAGGASAGATEVAVSHTVGIAVGGTVRIFDGDTGARIGDEFAVEACDPTTERIRIRPALPRALSARRGGLGDVVRIRRWSADPVPEAERTLIFRASSPGAWGDGLRVRVTPVVRSVHTVLGGAPARRSRAAGTSARRRRRSRREPVGRIELSDAARLYDGTLLELDAGGRKEWTTVASRSGRTVVPSGDLARRYDEGHVARLVEARVTVRLVSGDTVEAEEVFGPLRLVDDGTPSSLTAHVNDRSELVEVDVAAGYSASEVGGFPTTPGGGWLRLTGGDDRFADLTVDDFVGADGGAGARTGVRALADVAEVSVCVVPGVWSPAVRAGLLRHCEELGDRFAIVDPAPGLDVAGIRRFRAPIDTRNGALYYPWVRVPDPSGPRRMVEVAPSSHVAGIYARVDADRGVHEAPANEVVRGVDPGPGRGRGFRTVDPVRSDPPPRGRRRWPWRRSRSRRSRPRRRSAPP